MYAFTSFWAPNNMYNVCGTYKNASHQYNIYGSYRRGLKRSSRRSGWGRADSLRNVSCQKRDKKLSAMVSKHNETKRGESLVNMHTKDRKRKLASSGLFNSLWPSLSHTHTHTHTHNILILHFFLCFSPSLFQNSTVVKRLAVSVTDRPRPKKF